jgi:hypothetical protein
MVGGPVRKRIDTVTVPLEADLSQRRGYVCRGIAVEDALPGSSNATSQQQQQQYDSTLLHLDHIDQPP